MQEYSENNNRYELLLKQLQLPKEPKLHPYNSSLTRIIKYVCSYTIITRIELINENILYGYIEYHTKIQKCKNISFSQAIKDVRNYVKYLESMDWKGKLPNVDLSTQNFKLWAKIK